MGRYLIRRLIQMLPILFGLTVVIFLMLRLVPGDPAVIMLGNKATPENVARLRESLGLNKPIYVQYWIFLHNVASGNLGESLLYRQPVGELVIERLPPTLFLTLYATVLAIAITLPLATIAALTKDRLPDQLIRIALLIGLAMPSFWVGISLLLLLAVHYHLFPTGGYGENVLEHFYYLFLPALSVAIGMAAILVRNLRNSLLETLSADHVKTAYAKGLPLRSVFVWHVLRNSSLSTVTVLGINLGFLVGGTVIVEQVFAIPGVGQLLIKSVFSRDYPVVQGITLLFGVLIVVINLITDVVYALLDPRIRFD
jgi:peptide/nickel transport system permease protein